jgi:hypothetical protein
MSLNLSLALLPTAETAARQTTIIRASMTAYSTAVGPSSETMNFLMLFANFFIWNTPHVSARVDGPVTSRRIKPANTNKDLCFQSLNSDSVSFPIC